MESKNHDAKDAPSLSDSKDSFDLFSEKCYSQMYIVMKASPLDPEAKRSDGNEVLFSCGNWSYRGLVQFDEVPLRVSELPRIIPTLQKQQSNLRYFCQSSSIPDSCAFAAPAAFAMAATRFFGEQMSDTQVERELEKLARAFSWVEDDMDAATYFELETLPLDVPPCMSDIAIMASKMYVRGLIIITIFSNNTFYFVVQSGEGEQALLDVRFPDVTQRGQGMHLASYTLNDRPWQKLTLWHLLASQASAGPKSADLLQKKDTPLSVSVSVSSKNYQQTYCVLRSAWEGVSPTINIHHETLFRFGSWCYAGKVQLTPTISLQDIPFVIPALRLQQSRMEFFCPVDAVPASCIFAPALDYLQSHEAVLEAIIEQSAEALDALISRLTGMGLGDAVALWLDGDSCNSFFEFKLEPDEATKAAFKPVELVCSKSYHASGIITKQIFYNFTLYVCIEDGSAENPLLDSTFPDVSGKGRGYQIYNYAEPSKSPLSNAGPSSKEGGAATAPGGGHPEWPELKKVSIWQTVGALEQEFRSRAAAAQLGNTAGTGGERYPQFNFKSQADADKHATADEIIGDASIAGGSVEGLSLLAHPNDAHDNASLSQASTSELLPSGKACFPVMDDDKDWAQNTEGSSIADVGTGTIKGSVNALTTKVYTEFMQDEEQSLTASHTAAGATGVGSISGSVSRTIAEEAVAGGSILGDSAAGDSVASSSGANSIGGSWRSLGSVHGGSRGGLGGRGVVSRSISSSSGATGRDSQGREIIGSNYLYSDGYDIVEHSRIREREFVQDTHERNRADLKALQSENNTSLSGRINSFVNSYNSATAGVPMSASKPGSPKKGGAGSDASVPDVAEAKTGPSSNSNRDSNRCTGDKSGPNWDTLGGIVEQYEEKQLAMSRSQLLLTHTTSSESEAQGFETGAKGCGAGSSPGPRGDAALDDESVSTLGQDSVVKLASQNSLLQPQLAEPLPVQRATPNKLLDRPVFPKFGGGLPVKFGTGSDKSALPHHLPQMGDSLASRLDTMRAAMALGAQQHPPWDPAGNPLTKLAPCKATKK